MLQQTRYTAYHINIPVSDLTRIVIVQNVTQRVVDNDHVEIIHATQLQRYETLGYLTIGTSPIILFEAEAGKFWILDGQHRLTVFLKYKSFYQDKLTVELRIFGMNERPASMTFAVLFGDYHEAMPLPAHVKAFISRPTLKEIMREFLGWFETTYSSDDKNYNSVSRDKKSRTNQIHVVNLRSLEKEFTELLTRFQGHFENGPRDGLIEYYKWINTRWLFLAQNDQQKKLTVAKIQTPTKVNWLRQKNAEPCYFNTRPSADDQGREWYEKDWCQDFFLARDMNRH